MKYWQFRWKIKNQMGKQKNYNRLQFANQMNQKLG